VTSTVLRWKRILYAVEELQQVKPKLGERVN